MLQKTEKLQNIDALRGWAIFLVMLVHTAAILPNMPWPLKKITNFGWYGVQLFFIASAFTLLLSWHRNREVGRQNSKRDFFKRRFLRIAPMYYLGAMFYLIMRHPGDEFSFSQLFLSMSFINSWHPDWLGITDGFWYVVPGGWSISVEFCFYLMFPFLATVVNSLARARVFFALSLLIAFGSMPLASWLYPGKDLDIFNFFWLPMQLVVFSLGFMAFFTVYFVPDEKQPSFWNKHALTIIVGALCFVLALTQLGNTKSFFSGVDFLPTHITVSIAFAIILVAMFKMEKVPVLLVNKYITKLGEVSFSAYIFHFFVIDILHYILPNDILAQQGLLTALYCILMLIFVVLGTYVISRFTYTYIEMPCIKLSKKRFTLKPA